MGYNEKGQDFKKFLLLISENGDCLDGTVTAWFPGTKFDIKWCLLAGNRQKSSPKRVYGSGDIGKDRM